MGNKLRIAPFSNNFDFSIGRIKIKPQIPPHTIRGYNQFGDMEGAIETPNDEVIPNCPNSQTAMLLANAPKQPVAK